MKPPGETLDETSVSIDECETDIVSIVGFRRCLFETLYTTFGKRSLILSFQADSSSDVVHLVRDWRSCASGDKS